MAFFAPLVPILAGIGGGSAVAGGILAGTAILSGGIAAKSAHDAGALASAENKVQAKQAGDAARGREIERKRDLLKALGTQHAYAAAGGAGFGGSLAAIAKSDINAARNDLSADRVNTQTQQRLFRMRAANASQTGNLNAITSVLDVGTKLAGAYA
jgi:hypothetical protein